jgi:hypothetical protein
LGLGLSAVVALTGVIGAAAHEGEFAGGEETYSGGGYDAVTYASAPYQVYYDGDVYTYATGEDGKGYYQVYDGEWSEPYAYDDQPVDYHWEPGAVSINEQQYVFYAGTDGKYYHNTYDGNDWTGWEDVSGEYTFVEAPFAYDYAGDVWLYGVADDSYLYYKYWDSDAKEWTEWAPVSADYQAGAYQPHAVTWEGYNNVFWTGADGKVYWNRYSDESGEWTGERQIPYESEEYTYVTAPYAVPYEPTGELFAYAVTEDGKPNWNTFDGSEWSGWREYEDEYPATGAYQPYAYVYEDVQFVYVTADDGHAYYVNFDGEGHSEWYDLGENYAYQVSNYEYDDTYYLAYTGETGYLYYKEYQVAEDEDDGY